MKRLKFAAVNLTLAVMLCAGASAESHVIDIVNFQFVPPVTNILVGDTVVWSNTVSTQHTTTSGTSPTPNGFWSSGPLPLNATFSYTFTNAGTYPFFCSIHTFMTGSITVYDTADDVIVTDSGLSRSNATIIAGDFVRWTNASSSAHALVSGTMPVADGQWSSGTVPPGGVFSRQFNSEGVFPYFDSLNPTNPAYAGAAGCIGLTNIAFASAADVPSTGAGVSWVSADTRKYDLVCKSDLLSTSSFQMAEANIKASGEGVNSMSNFPFMVSAINPSNGRLFYRLNVLPDNIPALPLALDVVASNFVSPVSLREPNDGTHRLFVADQIGKIMIVDSNRNVLATPFLDISATISNLGPAFTGAPVGLNPGYDERGLQGLAFDPGFVTNRRVFVYYNAPATSTNFNCRGVLAMYQVSATNANIADTNGTIIFQVDKPEFNHNGGCITFGPDGYLYVPTGDGGGAGDQHGTIGNGQDTNSFLGKILRLDVSSGTQYTIPPDNPFAGGGGLPEIYAYGFRHPWRISFDRAVTNRFIVADVGQDLWEEVDFVQKGSNYGWRVMEGNHAYDYALAGTLGLNVTNLCYPIHEYGHGPVGIAIIGAAMYRGTNYPALEGKYVFGDFSTSFAAADGHLYYLSETRTNIWERFAFTLAPSNAPLGRFVKSFGEDQSGELYLLSSTNLGPTGISGDIRLLRKP